MGQLPLNFLDDPDLEQAARDVFDAWGQLRVWAICQPACVWCSADVSDGGRRRHLAAKRLAAALNIFGTGR